MEQQTVEDQLPSFENDYVDASWYSKFWMSWGWKIMMHINRTGSLEDPTQCVKMEEKDSSNDITLKLEANLDKMKEGKETFSYENSMLKLVLKTFKKQICIVIIWGLLAELIGVSTLFYSSYFVKWLRDDGEKYLGYIYGLSFVILVYVMQLFRVNYFLKANILGINIRKAISGIMYKKALRLNQKSKAISSTGKIVTIISGELQMIDWGIQMAPYIVIGPISTMLAFALIAINFKEGSAIGLLVFILIIISQILLSKITQKWKYKEGVFSDKRIDVISDSINGIRTIKTYGWEIPFQRLIKNLRNSQLYLVLKSHFISSLGFGVFQNGGFLIAIAIFGYHYAMEREFSYSRSLSTIVILGYLSQFSCYFLFTAFNSMAALTALLRRTGEVIGMEEYNKEKYDENESLPEGV
jgi:ABC-type bacteriocin/lantibiotic exporter with double-glycine peptidase domain